MKLALSPSAIKDFFVNHIEKLVLAGIAASLLVVCWNAFARDSLKTKPSDIDNDVEIFRTNITKSVPPATPPATQDGWINRKFGKVGYPPLPPFSEKIFPAKKDDDDPAMMAIQDMRVTTVVGPMAVRGAGVAPVGGAAPAAVAPKKGADDERRAGGAGLLGDEDEDRARDKKEAAAVSTRIPLPEGMFGTFRSEAARGFVGKRMVVLTGLVPIEQQLLAFQKAFSGKAPRTQLWQQQPFYGFYRVARRETSPDGSGKWDENYVPWTTLRHTSTGARNVQNLWREWAEPAPAVVSRRYHDELLTMPLPPMLLADWGANATHPKIPLRSAELALLRQRPAPQPTEKTEERPAGGGFDPEKMIEPGAGGFDRERDPIRRRPGILPRGERGRIRPGFGGVDGKGGVDAEEDELAELNKQRIKKKIFRFFDFDVKPGYEYQYRVQLYIQNPNYGIPPKFLANNKQKRFRMSAWSEESPQIMMPTDRRILGGPVVFDKDLGPVARALVVRWRNEQGTGIISEYVKKPHGSVLDKPESAWAIDPLGRAYVRVDSVDSNGMLVLDARGGMPVSSKHKDKLTPGEILLLTPEGELIVRRETDDAAEFQRRSVANRQPAEEEDMGKGGRRGGGVGVVGGGRRPAPKPGGRQPIRPRPGGGLLD